MKILNYWYILPLFILTGVAIALANSRACKQQSNLYTSEQRVLDSNRILFAQEKYFHNLDKEHTEIITAFTKKFKKDTTTHKTVEGIVKTEKNRVSAKLKERDSLLINKNATLYDLQQKYGRPLNVWLLISIILVCGMLGGIARTYYPLLDELKQAKQLQARATAQASGQGVGVRALSPEEVEVELKVLKEAVKQIEEKNKPSRVMFANLMFGIIASLLAFVAMEVFKSRVLDFKNVLDYFILAGWCTLGAVFAKKWLFAIHSKITK